MHSNKAINGRQEKIKSFTARSLSSLPRNGDIKSLKPSNSSNSAILVKRTNSATTQIANNTLIKNSKCKSLNEKIFAIAKRESETKIQFKLSEENNIIENNPSLVKDLPLTDAYQSVTKTIDVHELKSEVISMARNAYDKALNKESPISALFYEFLSSHSFKILQFLFKAGAAVDEAILEWKALVSAKKKDNLALAINIWATIQEKYLNFHINREKNHLALLDEFEDLEEKNLLLQDLLSQRSTYSTSSTTEIQVKQVVKEQTVSTIPDQEGKEEIQNNSASITFNLEEFNIINEIQNSELAKLEEHASSENLDIAGSTDHSSGAQQVITTLTESPEFLAKPKFKSRRTFRQKVDAEVQTNPISFNSDRPFVDLMDRATGPDREIAVYRGIGCQVDFRHPIEDKYEEMVTAYQYLEQEHEKAKTESAVALQELKTDFKAKIETQSNDAKTEITKLKSTIDELKQENERMEFELLNANSISAIQKAELDAVKEKIKDVTEKLEKVTIEEAMQRQNREEAEAVLQKTREEIIVMSKAVEEAIEANHKLQEEKNELEIKQEETALKLHETEQVLSKTEVSYQNAKQAGEKMDEIKAELEREKNCREELRSFNETLQAEHECVKELGEQLAEKNSDLEKIIAKLMEFPDLSLGSDFKMNSPPDTPEFTNILHHMIEHNNLRISLLEQRNKKFRDILLNQARNNGHEKYSSYHPISSSTVIFNMNAIDFKSRPTTADSTHSSATIKSNSATYIFGQNALSRPVSAVSVRLVRPASGKNIIEKALQKPIFSKLVNQGQSIQIDEGPETKYPPTRFPFLNPLNPLSIYDSSLLEDVPPLVNEKSTKLRSALKGSRPASAKSRPNSAVTFKWVNEEGGGHGSPTTLPKIWSWYGGYNPNPVHYVRNTFITGAFILTLTAVAFNISSNLERRVRYPDRWIPSMLWAKEFHDPKSVEMWKKQLKSEGREWIEPIPSWWY